MNDLGRPRRAQAGLVAGCLTAVVMIVLALGTFTAEAHAGTPSVNPSAVRLLELRAARIGRMVSIMEQIARNYRHWRTCLSRLPVSEYGDRNHRVGYHYDEKDGTGLDYRPALAVDRARRWPDFVLLTFAHRDECQSAPTRPGTPGSPGTADPARVPAPPPELPLRAQPLLTESTRLGADASSLAWRVRVLERRIKNLKRRANRLDDMSEHFDEWESCLSWVPVTEYGDPDGRYGYIFDDAATGQIYRTAITIDVSEWDDPDYFLIGFEGRDRPFTDRECEGEPGESTD
jgi:hypothetical protein